MTQKPLGHYEQKLPDIVLIDGQLNRRSFQGLLARCLGIAEAHYLMGEVHDGVSFNHFRVYSLVLKLMRDDYHWLRMEKDAKILMQKCDKCQCYSQLVHQPTE